MLAAIAASCPWKNFEVAEYRGKLLLAATREGVVEILAEIAPTPPSLASSMSAQFLMLKSQVPKLAQLSTSDLEHVFKVLITSFVYLEGSNQIMAALGDRLDGDAALVQDLNKAIRAAKTELDAVEARVAEEANRRIEAANREIDKLKSEKAELASQLEETKRSKKKLREALERMKEAR